jgi:hypothetical protein
VQITLGADDAVRPDIGSVEACDECCDSIISESQRRGRRFVNFSKLRQAIVDRDRRDLRRLCTKQVASGVDTVHPDVVQSAAAVSALRANVAPPDRHRERRIEELQLAQPSAAREVDIRGLANDAVH